MAASKKPRAKKTAPKRSKARIVKRKAVAKARPKPSPKKAPAKKMKTRSLPETLRLKSFTPSITVNDLTASLAFYEGGLGFVVGEKWMDGEVVRGVMLKAGASEFAISQDDWKMGRDRKKGVGFRIWCDTAQDLDAIAARVKSKGYTLTEEPEDHPSFGARSFSLDDPDGFHLTITRDL
jgi:uncharacterized glyoxalase superfamily protein PhnB